MIRVRRGNLLDAFDQSKFDAIVHGCNCFHAMGSGIAGQIAQRYPQAPEQDRRTTRGDAAKLSRYTVCKLPQGRIVNLYTQYKPGADFLPSLFPAAIRKLNYDFGGQTLGIPLIGCGIGGGDWEYVMNVLLQEGPDVDWEVYVL